MKKKVIDIKKTRVVSSNKPQMNREITRVINQKQIKIYGNNENNFMQHMDFKEL